MRSFNVLALLLIVMAPASADTVKYRQHGKELELQGTILGQTEDKSLVFESRDLRHLFIRPNDLIAQRKSPTPVQPYGKSELGQQLRKELGDQFKVLQTKNYTIIHSCPAAFAQQTGTLLERTRAVFISHLRNKGGFTFSDPPQSLIVIIYAHRNEYLAAAQREAEGMQWSAGMYSHRTNRIYFYDPSGGANAGFQRAGGDLDSRGMQLAVHEGVHQLAFNMGLHERYAFNPSWLVEGMASYFEAIDPESTAGWSGPGELHVHHLAYLREDLPRQPKGFLHQLVLNDKLFHQTSTNTAAYAQSWGLTWYLLRAKTSSYVRYLRLINSRPLTPYGPEDRLADFRHAFGKTPEGVELDFRRYITPHFQQIAPKASASR